MNKRGTEESAEKRLETYEKLFYDFFDLLSNM